MSLRTNLVSWWKLNETSSTRADSHGSNTLQDNNTVTYVTGKQGNAADFTPANSEYLSIADASQTGLDLSGDCTFSFWINQDATTGDQWVIGKSNFDTSTQSYDIWASGGTIQWRFSDDGSNSAGHKIDGTTSAAAVSAGSWYHVAVVFTIATDSAKCYVNGVDKTSSNTGTMGASLYNNAQPVEIGRRGRSTPTSYFNGSIDEVAVYSAALTAGEVLALYNNGDGITYEDTDTLTDVSSSTLLSNDLSAYWKLDETSGNRSDSHGSTTLTDNNTVLYGTGKQGNCADFEKDNTEYLSNSSFTLTNTMSFAFWINSETHTAQASILSKDNNTAGNRQFHIQLNIDGKIEVKFWNTSGTAVTMTSTTAISDTVWKHVVVTVNLSAGSGKMYFNGVDDSVTLSGTLTVNTTGTAAFYMGGRAVSGSTLPYDGLLDEVGIWAKVLSSYEIEQLYNSGSGIPYTASAAPTFIPKVTFF